MQSPVHDYGDIPINYSRRALRNDADALHALHGISQRFFDRMGCESYFGMPTMVFDHFVLFSGRDLRRRPGFPSYSWAGWRGHLHPFTVPDDINYWLDTQTWIAWFKNQNGYISSIWNPKARNRSQASRSNYQGYSKRLPFRHPELRIGITKTFPESSGTAIPGPQHYPVLQFWSLAIFLVTKCAEHSPYKGGLYGRDRKRCGDIAFDNAEELQGFDSQDYRELIVLSGADEVTESTEELLTAGVCSFYHVMLLKWDRGVAERRGIGKITRLALKNSYGPGPVWKQITLG